MEHDTTTARAPRADGDPRAGALPDPFVDEEHASWRTALLRVAIVAASTGARFEREGSAHDPAAWMLAPRRVFAGRCALDACQELVGFERALLLHAPGCDLGLDASPCVVDEMLAEDGGGCGVEAVGGGGWAMPRHDPAIRPATHVLRRPRRRFGPGGKLHSAAFARYDGGGRVLVFVAAVVPDERAFRNRLFDNYGAIAALGADVRCGFDPLERVAARLVSEHLAEELAALAVDPGRGTREGFAVVVEQRT